MRFDILSIFPDLIKSSLEFSIIKKAINNKIIEIYFHNLRDYSNNNYKKIDDYQYGNGSGMVLMIEPIAKCIKWLELQRNYDEIIYMTPDGEKLKQRMCNFLSLKKNIIILCGHYKGVDHRVRDLFITKEISIGDYVLSGGELAAVVLVDSIIRLIPKVLGDETSALTDCFQDGLLSPPIYTRPQYYNGLNVPEILLCGDLKKIDKWKEEQSFLRTQQLRPDLLD